MTVKEIAENLGFKLLAGEDGIENEVEGVYTCDLLSWVMGYAKEEHMWFTVMGNLNSIAVASLRDISAIVLTENASLDDNAKSKADQIGMPVYVTDKDSASAVIAVNALL